MSYHIISYIYTYNLRIHQMSNVNHNLLAAEAPRREAFTWIASKETVAAQLPSCADLSGYGWIIYSIYVYIYYIYIIYIYISYTLSNNIKGYQLYQ